jgi:hypothetical protein
MEPVRIANPSQILSGRFNKLNLNVSTKQCAYFLWTFVYQQKHKKMETENKKCEVINYDNQINKIKIDKTYIL